jgi:hypothetical protein
MPRGPEGTIAKLSALGRKELVGQPDREAQARLIQNLLAEMQFHVSASYDTHNRRILPGNITTLKLDVLTTHRDSRYIRIHGEQGINRQLGYTLNHGSQDTVVRQLRGQETIAFAKIDTTGNVRGDGQEVLNAINNAMTYGPRIHIAAYYPQSGAVRVTLPFTEWTPEPGHSSRFVGIEFKPTMYLLKRDNSGEVRPLLFKLPHRRTRQV